MKTKEAAKKAMKKPPATEQLKAMTPTRVKREIQALEYLYEHGDAQLYSDAWYNEQRARIHEASSLWAKKR